MTQTKRIAVIGAGISGLSCAYELQKSGFSVIVYEKEKFVGGRMSTRTKKDFPFDIGADHLANVYTEMRKYCNELNVSWQKLDFLKYGIIRNNNVIPLSNGVNLLSKMRLSLQFLKCKKGIDFFNLSTGVKYDKENAYDFMKKFAGKEIADYYIDPFASAYQFHSAKEISVTALFGIMQSIKHHKKDWELYETKGGMSALPNALARKLQVKTNKSVLSIDSNINSENAINLKGKKVAVILEGKEKPEFFDKVVIATTAGITKNIYKNPTLSQQNIIDSTKYSLTISIAFLVPTKKLHNFSVVWSPYIESKAISGFTNEKMKGKSIFNNEKSLLCVWLHEDFAKKIINKSDKIIFSLVKKEFINICSWFCEDELENYELQKWYEAMPKFSKGHITKVVDFLNKGQGENNVYLCGDYLNSPWTEGALRCGQRVAKQIIQSCQEQSYKH